MTEKNWVRRKLPSWKWHIVSAKNLATMEKLHSQDERLGAYRAQDYDPGFPTKEFVDEAGIDMPGMMFLGRRYEHLKVDPTFTLTIPSGDLAEFYERLRNAKPRYTVGGQDFYRVYGWMTCLFLDAGERQGVLKCMEAILPEATTRGKEDDQKLEDGLNAANKDAGRVLVVRASMVKNDPIAQGTPLSGLPNRERN